MCLVAVEKAIDRVPRKVLEWAMRIKGIPEVLVSLVMSVYEGDKTRVRVDSELSVGCEVKVWMYKGPELWLLLLSYHRRVRMILRSTMVVCRRRTS